MKLKDKHYQETNLGLPGSYREWWDIGNGYEIFVNFGSKSCSISISKKNVKDITYEVAKLLNLDVSKEQLTTRYKGSDELYVSMGIDCVILNYTKSENYKELLQKIEMIVNDQIK